MKPWELSGGRKELTPRSPSDVHMDAGACVPPAWVRVPTSTQAQMSVMIVREFVPGIVVRPVILVLSTARHKAKPHRDNGG